MKFMLMQSITQEKLPKFPLSLVLSCESDMPINPFQGTINTELLTMEHAEPTEYVRPYLEFVLSLESSDEPLLK